MAIAVFQRPNKCGSFRKNSDIMQVGSDDRGLGFVIHDNMGNILLASIKLDHGLEGVELEQASGYLFAIGMVASHGY